VTLTPETRVLLTDGLRPPAGYRVEVAVATTYSMNLTALLLAPLSFALFDETDGGNIAGVDPVRLLEAVRRHSEHTTVFCQASGIHVPSNYRSILVFVEDSVVEVMPPRAASNFHPKIWALRFTNPEGRRQHRLLVSSRNMTLDRCWDTALVLDETEDGGIDAAPAADFIRRLPRLSIRTVSEQRASEIADLADTIQTARLAAPSPFTEGRLLPIGLPDDPVWPFPEQARRLLAISPFLAKQAVLELAKLSTVRTLVSRAEALEQVGSTVLQGWNANVLQRLAEADPGDDISEAALAITEYQRTNDGLHAKTFVLDLVGGRSMTVTGSANLTRKTWGGSVEFDTVLIGPTSQCGVEATLNERPEAPGLTSLLQEYTPSTATGVPDPAVDTSYALERFHQQLALSAPRLHVTELDDDRVDASLTWTIPEGAPGETTVWLSSLPRDVHGRPLADTMDWTIAHTNVTPFVAIETVAGDGDDRMTRRCVLKAALTGAVDGRRRDAVFSILRSKEDVLRYLVFLLGDPSYDALLAQFVDVEPSRRPDDPPRPGPAVDVALFEPLVRATGRDVESLARVASLVDELRDLPNGEDLVPTGFDGLWDLVWQVHQERRA
jgi:hypothetical protein